MLGLQCSVVFTFYLVTSLILSSTTLGYYLRDPSMLYRNENLDRDKRYTDSQDRASAFCTGMCMYEQRKAYSDCYDLCNWNGRSPNPWAKLERTSELGGGDVGGVNSVENVQAMMRTGAGGAKMKQPRHKSKAG